MKKLERYDLNCMAYYCTDEDVSQLEASHAELQKSYKNQRHTIQYLIGLLDTWRMGIITNEPGGQKLHDTLHEIIWTQRRKLDPDPEPIEYHSHESEARAYVRANQDHLRREQGYE